MISVWGILQSIFRFGDLNLIRDGGHGFSYLARKVSGIRIELKGSEHLNAHQPCIYVANHQGNLDLITFGGTCPDHVILIGKKELMWIPFFGLYLKASGCTLIDRKDRIGSVLALKNAAISAKKKGASIFVFPEGTRNRTDQPMLPFKKGAFYMAIQSQVPIVPIVSSPVSRLVDRKNRKFLGGVATVTVLPPVSTVGMKESDVDQLIEQVRNQMLAAFHG